MGNANDVDSLLRVLSNDRRRDALSCLSRHDTVTLADLADELAEQKHGTTIDEIPPDEVKTVYMELYHRHVPKMEAADLLQYDQEQDCVTITDAGSRVASTVNHDLQDLPY